MEAFITDSTSFLVVTCSFSSNFFFLNPFSLLLSILTGEENHNHWGLVGRRKQSKPKLTKIRCRKPKIRKRDRFPPRTGFTFRDATLASLRPIWAISSEQEWGVGFRFVHTTVLCFASTQFRLFGTRGPGGGGCGAGLLPPTSGRLRFRLSKRRETKQLHKLSVCLSVTIKYNILHKYIVSFVLGSGSRRWHLTLWMLRSW